MITLVEEGGGANLPAKKGKKGKYSYICYWENSVHSIFFIFHFILIDTYLFIYLTHVFYKFLIKIYYLLFYQSFFFHFFFYFQAAVEEKSETDTTSSTDIKSTIMVELLNLARPFAGLRALDIEALAAKIIAATKK